MIHPPQKDAERTTLTNFVLSIDSARIMNTDSSQWQFDSGAPWTAAIDIPRFPLRTADLCDLLVPELAARVREFGPPLTPCVIVARITTTAGSSRAKGCAKRVLDSLHDRRKLGKKFADYQVAAPLPDDDPRFVHGLAVEISRGSANRVEYRIGNCLLVRGRRLASIAVESAAPNDVWANQAEHSKITSARTEFMRALVGSCRQAFPQSLSQPPTALVVRHHPLRDEDNTWGTWAGALLGARWSLRHWPTGPPLGRWSPLAMASVSDANLEHPTCYELWGQSPAADQQGLATSIDRF